MLLRTIGLIISSMQLAMGAPAFKHVTIELPAGTDGYVTGLNENGEVVGYFRGPDGGSKAFYWTNGLTTILNGFQGEAEALGLNNVGQIVGRAKKAGVWRAWVRENGTDVDLGDDALESSAVGVNDQGVIIGNMLEAGAVVNGFLSRPRKEMLTCCTGGPNGPVDWRVRAIHNNGMLLGENFLTRDLSKVSDRVYLYPETAETRALNKFGNGFGLNSTGAVAGEFRYGISSVQAGIWRNGNWESLGAPIHVSSRALGINDHDEAVGFAGERGMFWSNGTGAELDGLVELSAGLTVRAGMAINNRSQVAALLERDGRAIAGVLEPLGAAITLPRFSLAAPRNGSVQETNRVLMEINVETAGSTPSSARFVMDRRRRQDAFGVPPLSWTPTTYHSEGYATNEIVAPPFRAAFQNVPAGQYVAGTQIISDGLVLHLPPVFLAVTGEASLWPYRVNFVGEFEYGMIGSPGLLYDVEGSSDLVNWTTLNASTEGGVFSQSSRRTNVLFLRARAVGSGTNYFGEVAPQAAQAPDTLPNGELRFWSLDNQLQYEFDIEDGVFVCTTPLFQAEGTYTYSTKGAVGRFRAVDPREPEWGFEAEIQFPIVRSSLAITYFKAQIRDGDQTSNLIGRLWTAAHY